MKLQVLALARRAAAVILAASAALAAGCASVPPSAPRVIAFGDSLTDLGTFARRPGVRTAGRFTTNPGPLWVEVVAANLGTSIGPNRRAGWGAPPAGLGGLGYAEAGARVAQPTAKRNTEANAGPGSADTILPVRAQVGAYLAAHGRFAPADVVLVWAGANDLFLHTFGAPVAAADGERLMREAARDLAAEVARLVAAGAGKVVVLTIDDYGEAPATLGSPKRPMMSAWTRAFNDEVARGVAGMRQVAVADAGAVLREARQAPQRFGLKNSLDSACDLKKLPDEESIFCDASTLVERDANLTYLYADGVHPSTAGHRIVAGTVMEAMRRAGW
ncbi:SGNH/GDSL hydrolase family protein [Ramlibacter sp.]|uniref:SGNH/GDSL hydrolase family protein n=1 Tax=Ramlibacter sp. TaxID=1917967 RepID=UPI002C07BCE4|nr:SGNH/GDSL hydrolase family protein [Ramlibacter sp.]HWI80847.1 SGNH/GDSL hydrolase family protein [Ramlibacter sp.]